MLIKLNLCYGKYFVKICALLIPENSKLFVRSTQKQSFDCKNIQHKQNILRVLLIHCLGLVYTSRFLRKSKLKRKSVNEKVGVH